MKETALNDSNEKSVDEAKLADQSEDIINQYAGIGKDLSTGADTVVEEIRKERDSWKF